jgi:hypothetical protein
MRILSAVVALAACSFSSAQAPPGYELACHFTEKRQCSPGSECIPAPLITTVNIDLDGHRYQRCSNGTCDTYDDARITRSGIWHNIELPGRALFAKVDSGGDQIVEVSSLNLSVLVGYGRCRPST